MKVRQRDILWLLVILALCAVLIMKRSIFDQPTDPVAKKSISANAISSTKKPMLSINEVTLGMTRLRLEGIRSKVDGRTLKSTRHSRDGLRIEGYGLIQTGEDTRMFVTYLNDNRVASVQGYNLFYNGEKITNKEDAIVAKLGPPDSKRVEQGVSVLEYPDHSLLIEISDNEPTFTLGQLNADASNLKP